MRSQTEGHGFTLVELLVSIAIILVLTAIVLPVYSRGKAMAKRTTCTSNLRQCGVATLLYCEENDGLLDLPADRASVVYMLRSAPTDCLADFWRNSPKDPPPDGTPLFGSYAYVRWSPPYDKDEAWRSFFGGWTYQRRRVPLLVCVFHSSEVFAADGNLLGAKNDGTFSAPDHLLMLLHDGSVLSFPWKRNHEYGYTWATLFSGPDMIYW